MDDRVDRGKRNDRRPLGCGRDNVRMSRRNVRGRRALSYKVFTSIVRSYKSWKVFREPVPAFHRLTFFLLPYPAMTDHPSIAVNLGNLKTELGPGRLAILNKSDRRFILEIKVVPARRSIQSRRESRSYITLPFLGLKGRPRTSKRLLNANNLMRTTESSGASDQNAKTLRGMFGTTRLFSVLKIVLIPKKGVERRWFGSEFEARFEKA